MRARKSRHLTGSIEKYPDNHMKVTNALEKDDKALRSNVVQGSKNSYNAKENRCKDGFHSESIINSKTGSGENDASQLLNKNLNHGSALKENAFSCLGKISAPDTSFVFHASMGKGINIIVDLNSSPSELFKGLENEVFHNCCCAQNNNRFQSLREELENLGNNRNQVNNKEKPMDNDHKQADSIQRDSYNCMNFSNNLCQEKNASYSSSGESALNDVDRKLDLEKGRSKSAVSRNGICAEEQGYVHLAAGAETSANAHEKMSLEEKPKRKRPSSKLNLRILTRRSMRLNSRVLPRRSMRLTHSQ